MKTVFIIAFLLTSSASQLFSQDSCLDFCGWWIGENKLDQFDEKFDVFLYVGETEKNNSAFILRMPPMYEPSILYSLTEEMTKLVLTDSSSLSPLLVAFDLKMAKSKGKFQLEQRVDRFGLPEAHASLQGLELSIGKKIIRPSEGVSKFDGRLSADKLTISLKNEDGQVLDFKRIKRN